VGAQVSDPGESQREAGPASPASDQLARTGPRRVGPLLIAGAGVAGLVLMAAVFAGGTAPSTGPSTQPTDDPAALRAPTAPAPSGPSTSTTEPPVSSAAPAAPKTAHPRTAAPTTAVPTTTSTAAAAAPAPPATSDGECGGQPTADIDGQTWQCRFDDEFDGTTLDTSKWVVQQTSDGGYHSGLECFEDSPGNVSVSGGSLNLTVEQAASSFLCPGEPPYYTQYTSGMVSTYQHFTQTDGLFEVRAKISGAATQGLQSSFWLYPAQPTYGAWPASGEIDIAELFSQYPTLAIPFVHYNNSAGDPEATNDHCAIGDPGQFHTYALQWTPQSLNFLYDGQACLVDRWSSASPLIDPAPFNEPFYICLTQALGIGTNEFIPGTTPLPATTSIDWVRVWGAPASSG
jgi:beta-glucanase (GH16 family)